MWVCITSHCGEFVLNTFLCGEFVYYITLWWVCITSFYGEFVISPFVVSLYCITLCYITVVGLYYITLWWVCNTSLCGEWQLSVVVFLYHLFCGVFISSTLWWFFFSMVHPILVRFYYFPLLFIIYDFHGSQMIFASILFKDTDHLLINLSGNVPGSRVTVPKNQPSIFLW